VDVAVERLRFDRGGRTVLDVPALAFLSGTTTAVFGPNGSGKTTLLRLIAGLESPTEGRIRVGRAAAEGRTPRPRDVAYGFQEPVFVRGTVRRNLDLALRLRELPPGERAARIAEAARECGIEPILDRQARQLSSGEARRGSLARTLALRAPVTLLDEPLAGIDRVTRLHLLDDLPRLLATFATTTVLVTHDREEAFRLAAHLVVLVDGQVRAAGPKGTVYAHPPDRVTAELLGYTVVRAAGRLFAVPSGGLHLLPGDGSGDIPELWMTVERVVDMGNHRHAVGSVDGERADLRLPDGAPAPRAGDRLRIGARGCLPLP
jgi:ABC-type sugar transport system ATPase subunit